ncbi:hypothetical protein MYU51_017469 [Penicillium brevicompactum]|uniref:uncharacterized protein n=1 Tax=Penicillium brevicompactum TaxID=5074 RepID=UPI0025426387|nr:uncharacterized protein N7506_012106 [Penicillium brevicompactum]KAJ5319402.1 hypothetical protein N7506_012106 [Penicillium brevicompactum]
MARGVPVKPREQDYSNVGTTGRRTGISLKEGRRDEHGMEEVDGLFSSPEKSPTKFDGFEDENDSSIGSDGMSLEEGNAPGPMDFLKGSNGSRSSFLPPSATRSPMKTGLGGSPRRTPALQSTPDSEDLQSSSPSDGKGQNESHLDPSPLSARSVNVGRSNQQNGARQRPTKAQLTGESEPTLPDFSDDEGDENAFAQVQSNFGNSLIDEDPLPTAELSEDSEPDQHEHEDSPPPAESPPRAKAAVNPKSAKNSKPAKPAKSADTEQPQPKSTGRRGRPPKSAAKNTEEDPNPRPAKKQKSSATAPPPEREPLEPELDRVVNDYANRTGPLKGRSLYILKRENPTDSSATHTRSGRVSVRPLAYWRNERCVFGDGEAAEGHRYPVSTIKEIIRTEEQENDKKKKGKRSSQKSKSKSKKRKDESSDEEDDEVDLWEKEGGVLHGYTLKWDSRTQASSKEEEVLDIAYAPSGIETREVKGSTFRFAKLLSSSFIGSGVVELPADGVKKPKNSKKMHMVFYVCHGRVQVDISGVQFSAGKGCVFQIPRGNYYSFANPHRKEARLFFTQGCVPDETEGEEGTDTQGELDDNETSAVSRGGSPETDVEAEPAPAPAPAPVKKAKGRPKGKQKKAGK